MVFAAMQPKLSGATWHAATGALPFAQARPCNALNTLGTLERPYSSCLPRFPTPGA